MDELYFNLIYKVAQHEKSPPQCCTDARVVIEEDEERDEEVCHTVEDDIAGHHDLGKVSPTATKRLVCVTSHLQNKNHTS